jgi:hypothetical protein
MQQYTSNGVEIEEGAKAVQAHRGEDTIRCSNSSHNPNDWHAQLLMDAGND